MSTFKKTKVVMLPTNEKAGKISMGNTSLKLDYHIFPMEKDGIYTNHTYQHLYFLSDEEIKEGDWMLHNLDEKPIQWNGEETNPSVYGYKKIIATTDKSLKDYGKGVDKIMNTFNDTFADYLPQPSQSFIEKFVEEYNKGNVITEVLVEYEYSYRKNDDGENIGFKVHEPLMLKINPKDNTITIRKAKDSWSREEVVKLLQKLAENIDDNYRPYTRDNNIGFDMVNNDGKWIEENL